MLAQIIKLVQEAREAGRRCKGWWTKLQLFFVPVVIGIAILTFITWSVWPPESGSPIALICAITFWSSPARVPLGWPPQQP